MLAWTQHGNRNDAAQIGSCCEPTVMKLCRICSLTVLQASGGNNIWFGRSNFIYCGGFQTHSIRDCVYFVVTVFIFGLFFFLTECK